MAQVVAALRLSLLPGAAGPMVASMQRSAATGASETGSEFPNQVLWAVFAALAAAGAASAFVGFSRSGYWTDELFTLFVIDHDGGLGEVLRRALTDTHPPAYYFLLYEWSRLAGLSEAALRVSSAVCAVAAAGVFYVGLRGLFSRTARAFALAMSLNAGFWFQQSQNIRSYSLCMLISAALLVLALAARASGADQCPVLAWAVHDLPPEDAAALRDRLARAPGVGPARVAMTSVLHESYEDSFYSRWPGAFIYRAIPALPPTAGPRRAP